jgi:PAS domain-containing protein
MLWRSMFAVALALVWYSAGALADAPTALDFAVSQPVIDIGPSLSPRAVQEPTDPNGLWFTIAVQNRSSMPVARVLVPMNPPSAALAATPMPSRPALIECAASDPAVAVERELAISPAAFRIVVPAGDVATLALHFEYAPARPALLAWLEPALIANARQTTILSGLVWGLLTAAAAFAAGAAALSSRLFPSWAALFLLAALIAELTVSGAFDATALTAVSGPFGLFALALAFAVAAAIRLVDYIAPFEAFRIGATRWRDRAALAIIALGIAAYVRVPFAALLVQAIALIAASLFAGYLAHCGRIGIAAARRLAPAAAIFALITAAAACNAFGLFGLNLIASGAIRGFSAAGALLIALATATPVEHSIGRLRELRRAHEHDDLQAVVTDEAIEQEWEMAAVAASHQGVFNLDLATGQLALSAEAASLLGFSADPIELTSEQWLNRIHPDDRVVYEQALAAYRHHAGAAFRVEFRVCAPGDRTQWCELRATMTGQAAKAERCLGLIADITGRKNFEAATASGF